jgi:DNA-binding protein HU-beta
MATGKTDLAAYIAKNNSLTKDQAGKVIDSLLAGIRESLQKGEEVRLIGFGTFAVQKTAARAGRNPRTGETIKIAASNRATFRAGKELKETLNSTKR